MKGNRTMGSIHKWRALLAAAAWLIAIGWVAHAAELELGEAKKPARHPYFANWYDARRNLPLASSSAGTLTEMDLLLHQLMSRSKDQAIFQTWEQSRRARARQLLAKGVESALFELAVTVTLAKRAADAAPSPTDEKFIRYLKYPIYQMVWIDRVLRPSIRVEPIDLIKYYHDHAADYYQPESARVRYIFREVSLDAPIAERMKIEEDMKALRDQVGTDQDFVELARAHSDAPSAVRGGELPLLGRGMFVEEFESRVFALEPGRLSEVFWGPGGLYLIQCVEKSPAVQRSFAEVQDELREEVEHQTLQFLYDYHLRRLMQPPTARALHFRFLELQPPDRMFIIGRYELTKNQFLDIFPYVLTPPLTLDLPKVSGIGQEILEGEFVAQEIEKRQLTGDPLLVKADQMARQMWQAQQALRRLLMEPLQMDEKEIRKYYEENRDPLGYQPQWRVLRVAASLRNPYLRHPSQVAALRNEMRGRLEQTMRDLRSAFLEERAKQAEHLLLDMEPSTTPLTVATLPEDDASTATARIHRQMLTLPRCVGLVTEGSTADYEFTVTDLGFRSVGDEKTYLHIKGLGEGDYSPILSSPQGTEQFCYFIERHLAAVAADYEQIRPHVRQQYIAGKQIDKFLQLRAALKEEAALSVRLPEISAAEK